MDADAVMDASHSHDTCDIKADHHDHSTKPTSALTPPTSEEFNHEVKIENDESELSDLDMSDDDEEIEPDHYWDGGRIPVFKPTLDQFRSFKKYIKKIDKYGMKSGIVKVIPPKEWRDSLPVLHEMIKRIKIKNPITQEFVGTFGTYTQQNVEKQRSYNLPEWKTLTQEMNHQPPAKRGERRRNQEKIVRGGGAAGRKAANRGSSVPEEPVAAPVKGKPGRKKRGPAVQIKDENEQADSESPSEPPPKKRKPGRPAGKGQTRSVTSRRLNNTAEAADWIDEKAFKNFDYHMDGLDEFTPERCAELETHYWKSLGFNAPMYAADMPGSLFDDTVTSWNVAKLENLLDVLGTKVPGVNTAYLYLGMWKATFAWHLEDVDLYSINYIHFGAPKQWYSISQEDARRFEAAMKHNWPVDAKNCDQFLRHKTYLISPDVLQKQYNVKVNKLVHYEGEFVITYPYGYHSGYNLGYNCAESVNFATESWLDYGRIARKCNCEADNVWVDVAEIERKLRGEPTPEFYEETDDDDSGAEDDDSKLPTPPASVRGQKTAGRKRKRDEPKQPVKKKKIRIRIKTSTNEPCCLCPNDQPWEPLLPTDNGKNAHRVCATYTPETYIAVTNNLEQICGVTTIDRARLEMKCNFCRSKKGAVFQCSAKKCTRAFHATCALAAGVQIDCGPVPTFGEDGTEYVEEGYDFRCKFHRPKMPKNTTVDTLENSKRVMAYAQEVKSNDVVQAQLIGGDVFAGLVVENRPGEQTLLIEVLPDGDRIELEWKYLAVMHPEDSHRLKPSPQAVPMPAGMNKQLVSIDNRQDGVPSQDEPFLEDSSLKWAEFKNTHMPPSGLGYCRYSAIRTMVNLDTPEQLFYYLPNLSTDAKSFWTDQANGKEHNPRSNPLPVEQRYRQPIPGPYSTTMSASNMAARVVKPYIYKPKSTKVKQEITIDQQALANQRNFAAQAGRMGSYQAATAVMTDSKEPVRNSSLRLFPSEQYYSTKILPAAFPGEYSGFTQEVRRQSQGAQILPKPDFSSTQVQHSIPTPTTMIQSAVMTNASSSPNDSRPSSSSHGQQNGMHPLTPMTTVSTLSKPQTRPQTGYDGNANEQDTQQQWTPPSQRPDAINRKYTPPIVELERIRRELPPFPTMTGKIPNTESRTLPPLAAYPPRPPYSQPSFESRWGHQSVSPWQNTPITPSQPPQYGHSNPGSHAGAQFVNNTYETFQAQQNTAMKPAGHGLELGPMLPRMESPGMSDVWK